MATNLEIYDGFLTPMKRLFMRPPHSTDADETSALAEYADGLKRFTKASLEAGWRSIRDSQTGRYWPPVAICIKACSACQQAFKAERQPSGPKPIAGRMVDGRWQPWIGCECDRCLAAKEKYHADNVWWYEFVAKRYGEGALSPSALKALRN